MPESFAAGRPLEHRLGEVAGLGREGHERTQDSAPSGRLAETRRACSAATTVAATIPPISPAYVFDGEMWVRNFRRPNRWPMKYAPVSYAQTARTRSRIQPRSGAEPRRGRAGGDRRRGRRRAGGRTPSNAA